MNSEKKISSLTIHPIGYFRTQKKDHVFQSKLSAPRQSGLGRGQNGVIKILPKYREALQDLQGFTHLWIVFHFHNNTTWKPLVLPPRSQKKRGVFATRSPYRPNPIGLSCVRLLAIEGLNLHLDDTDLLDGTPILDLKPYLSYSDAITDAKAGWTETADEDRYVIQFIDLALKKIRWIQKKTELPIEETILTQLEFDPFNQKKKRIKKTEADSYEFSYRTWRIYFQAHHHEIQVMDIRSGYTSSELKKTSDPYGDKDVHHLFLKHFQKKSE